MKDTMKIFLTIIITSLLWLIAMQDANYNNLRKNEKEIWLPMRMIISDLKVASDQGEHDVVNKKIKLLEKKWGSYSEGGHVPRIFYKEIISIGNNKDKSNKLAQ